MALNPWMIIPLGLVFGIVYFLLFRFLILRFNLSSIGREPEINTVTEDEAVPEGG